MKIDEFFQELRTVKIGARPWFSDYVFDKRLEIGRLKIRVDMRKRNGWMGRFGGGWNWKLGISIGGSTVLIDLLVISVSISWMTKEVNSP